jgi:hypothetical protein
MTAVAPFFPRYMFIVLDPERIGLVMQGDRAQPLAWDRQDTCCLDGNGRPPAIAAATAVGDSVQLSQGPFAEYLGTFDRLDDSDRVRVPHRRGIFLGRLGYRRGWVGWDTRKRPAKAKVRPSIWMGDRGLCSESERPLRSNIPLSHAQDIANFTHVILPGGGDCFLKRRSEVPKARA